MPPEPNTAPLIAAARKRRELTRAKASQALRELDRTGAPVSFEGVARRARISRSWLYGQPDIRAEIERLRDATQRSPSPQIPAAERSSDASLHARLAAALKRNRQLVEENQSLRRRIMSGLLGGDVSGAEYDPGMRASGTFKVADFTPAPVPSPAIETALPVGVATMEKQYEGEVAGRSATLFTAAFEQSTGTGTYVAMESFEGALHGQTGVFNFAHSATTLGEGRESEFFVIVPASGTGALAGITGTGGIAVDADGTHRIWFDYELGQ